MASSTYLTSTSASPDKSKRGRDPDDEVYLDNFHSHKHYLSKMRTQPHCPTAAYELSFSSKQENAERKLRKLSIKTKREEKERQEPDGVVRPQADPVGDGAILAHLLRQLLFDLERLVRRLQETKMKRGLETGGNEGCRRDLTEGEKITIFPPPQVPVLDESGAPGNPRQEPRYTSTCFPHEPRPPKPWDGAAPEPGGQRAEDMAVGKNKRISKGKKGGKKKTVDPFTKKDWYDIKAPSVFSVRNVGKTLVSRTQGTKIASEGLKHRVFEVSLADLQNDEDQAYRKIRLRAEDVQGKNVLTNFWGMNFTTDKLRSLVRKWQTLIEAHVDVKTTDNYTLRLFCIAFTKRRPNQVKRTCYAQSSQIRQIRRKMTEIMVNQASSCDLKDLVQKFIPEVIGKEIEKATTSIFPLQNVFIRKVKILKAPKFDLGKLMEVHGDYKEDVGVKLDRPAEDVPMEGESEAIAA
ncbi:hypothetical protein ZIOFF_006640 [Zingiber officinale]|uniref:Small ribosomal subunit protein eS1 n=3 Tax=Zingiber officinale TaxID=94328 RepID=A0A8J5HVT6_ZINOF|nr:hypothetical protein ZIOFF_006640 [Zingiber officinale]